MPLYQELQNELRAAPMTWLITGVAGFIGSNLLETLLQLEQRVTGLDNFSTGKKANLAEVQSQVTAAQWSRFEFIAGDLGDLPLCLRACAGVDLILHQAALGSVPRSMADPIATHQSNATGFLNVLVAARDCQAKRFVYASSSAVYGDHPGLPKVEPLLGRLLSPYAATKLINEIYADVFARVYGLPAIGLRYFNVFGPRQDPAGAYAAVIPHWVAAMLQGQPAGINGDGETSRDFCHVENVVQANLLAATTKNPEAINQTYNIALGERTTLNELFHLIQAGLRKLDASLPELKPSYQDFRAGDVRHSLADISQAQRLLGYAPACGLQQGLETSLNWYKRNLG